MRCTNDGDELEMWLGPGVASVYNGGGCIAAVAVALFVRKTSAPLPAYKALRLARLAFVDGRMPLNVGEKIEATNLRLRKVVGIVV
jgi:hypothetical protein